MKKMLHKIRHSGFAFPVLLLTSILCGMLAGLFLQEKTVYLKPIGETFVKLLLTAIVPLVFFSVAHAISQFSGSNLGKAIFSMLLVFLMMGTLAACYMLIVIKLFPIQAHVLPLNLPPPVKQMHIANFLAADDFSLLFSHHNMLPLILFSILVGLGTTTNQRFKHFLASGIEVFTRVISLIMLFAPIGLFAYFADIVATLGNQIINHYFHIILLYYLAGAVYLMVFLSACIYLLARPVFANYFKCVSVPLLTALGTCSSAASIPAAINATEKLGVPPQLASYLIPLGTMIHKQGSVLSSIVKIAFLFSVYHFHFAGLSIIIPAILLSQLVASVMGAIPTGGMMGELLILNWYGLPVEALVLIAVFSIAIDPLATMINVKGNIVCTILTSRYAPIPAVKTGVT